MEKKNPYLEIYDQVFFVLWDITTGQGGSKRTLYSGARYFARFLLSEIDRYEEVKSAGGLSIERHGLVAPMSIIKAWTFNILEDCHESRITPPSELCEAIYYLMGCRHLSPKRGKPHTKEAYLKLLNTNPDTGIREAARQLDVNPSTILRWQNGPRNGKKSIFSDASGKYDKDYERIRKLTNVEEFYPMRWRVLRKKQIAQHEQDVP